MTDLIERLRSAADAYPEDVFGKTTDEDRRAHGDVVQRAAATMGRHMAPLLREAAAALEAAREDAERLDWLASEAPPLWGSRDRGGYELPYFYITSGRECCDPGDLRAAIDQARGKGGCGEGVAS